MSIARGFALVLTEGFSLSSLPASFGWIGKSSIMGLPALVLLMLIMVVIFDLLVRHIASSDKYILLEPMKKLQCCRYSCKSRTYYCIYSIRALAALAGVLLASRLMSGTPTAGNGIELQVLAAAVIGVPRYKVARELFSGHFLALFL